MEEKAKRESGSRQEVKGLLNRIRTTIRANIVITIATIFFITLGVYKVKLEQRKNSKQLGEPNPAPILIYLIHFLGLDPPDLLRINYCYSSFYNIIRFCCTFRTSINKIGVLIGY